MSTDVEAAGLVLSEQMYAAEGARRGRNEPCTLRQWPLMEALPRRGPGRMRLHRRRRWKILSGCGCRAVQALIAVA
jgi:hypothetical protein